MRRTSTLIGYLLNGTYKHRFDALPTKTRLTLSLATTGIVSLLIGLTVVSILFAPRTFGKAKSIVGKKLLKTIVTENYSGADSESIYKSAKAMNVDGKFYIIDFNNPALCGNVAGQNGCLYVAYTPSANKILNLYLNPTVIKDRPLIQVSDQQKDGFPCLKISQANNSETKVDDAIQVYDYCYSAGTQSFIRIVDGLEKPVLLPSPSPQKTPVQPKKKGKGVTTNPTPTPTPVLSPT
ncbi:MAG TPA: hypothetical protein DCE56_03845 [Cyanobacteria bacterium UBA8553]|nr:hypothetical protein [Cyanobacteria bacterium UBA8553]